MEVAQDQAIVQNFSPLACLEVAEKFWVGWVRWVGFAVTTMLNLNPRYIELELGLGYDKKEKSVMATVICFDDYIYFLSDGQIYLSIWWSDVFIYLMVR